MSNSAARFLREVRAKLKAEGFTQSSHLTYAVALRRVCRALGREMATDAFANAGDLFQQYLAKRCSPSKENFFVSREWKRLRYKAFLRYGKACQLCGAGPTAGKPLHVDHIKPRSKYPELQLSLDNLQVLCEDCNEGKGAWDETDWRS